MYRVVSAQRIPTTVNLDFPDRTFEPKGEVLISEWNCIMESYSIIISHQSKDTEVGWIYGAPVESGSHIRSERFCGN
jgi:hypothetical protein